MPYCRRTGKQRRHKQDLGETLAGSRKIATPYDLTFMDPVPWRSLCEEYMDVEDVCFMLFVKMVSDICTSAERIQRCY